MRSINEFDADRTIILARYPRERAVSHEGAQDSLQKSIERQLIPLIFAERVHLYEAACMRNQIECVRLESRWEI